MRKTFLLLFLALAAATRAPGAELPTAILKQLRLKSDQVAWNFVAGPVSTEGGLTAWVIPVKAWSETGTYDSHDTFELDCYVVLADPETGKVVSRYHRPEMWYSDVWRLMSNAVVALPAGELHPDRTALGVATSFSGFSRVNPAGETVVELFVQEGKKLLPVFRYTASEYNGEEQADGGWWMEETTTVLQVLEDRSPEGFAGISLQTESETCFTGGEEPDEMTVRSDSPRFYHYTDGTYKEINH